ncbi:SGNH hydrolase-type esterase domain-containing protein [Mycena metata]|uniref:SGNH hydrolase-type esterase domain-containing protein n=1 Tax=Mycena metata TaxID=1033252 RepID=A0AAD7NBB2_9AGAR|nr:SGNH hydrolase-type esterase domain-containing protein [Mycena metata]
MPLGDSITFGVGSSTGDGYRRDLQGLILNNTNTLNYIGSLKAGDFADNDNEGHSGAIISQIAAFAEPTLRQRPNVIFLLAGTNDINRGLDISNAPGRLIALVDHIFVVCPDAVVLLGTIPRNGDATKEPLVTTYNDAVQQLVLNRTSTGKHIVVVGMNNITAADMVDTLHPNDAGYSIMALAWYEGLVTASINGWIQEPVAPDVQYQNEYCGSNPEWIAMGVIATGPGLGSNGGLSNCLASASANQCTCVLPGPASVKQSVPRPASGNCADLNDNSTSVRFADLTGDGRAEYLWLDINGVTTGFLNSGGPDTVGFLPQGVVATGVGAKREQVHFADLNGDGRAEYLWVHDNGSVNGWFNAGGRDDGPNAAKIKWVAQGTVATGIGRGVRFADLNGDGRSEYLYLEEDGAMSAWLNIAGPNNGPNAAKPGWLAQGVVATGPKNGATRDYIILADINGDGRADYLTVDKTTGAVDAWINGGGPDEELNAAKVSWISQGTIATGVGDIGWAIQFADLTGDGRSEYIDVAYNTSGASAWFNGC